MTLVLPEGASRRPSIGQRLSEGVGRGLEMGSQMMEERKLEQQYHQENKAAKNLGMDLTGIRDPKLRQQALEYALQGQNQIALEKQKQLSEKNKLTGETEQELKDFKVVESSFGKKFADIWKAAPTGGRTELLKTAIEASMRGDDINKLLQGLPENQETEQVSGVSEEKISPQIKIENELDSYLKKQDDGLLPAEKVKRGKERFDTGLKQYQEAGVKLRSMNRDKDRLGILEDLDKSDKLPKDLERLNVDEEGNLRLPFLASPEAQRFVKTLNEFSEGAKDTFGSRVTNFDLAQYLRRYPTLLNSKEGRRQLIQQMKVVNQINSVYYKNLKSVYDKAGGVRNIDADIAERFAEQLSEDKVSELSKKFAQIGEFSTKPNAAEFKGKKIRDKETGEVLVSDGIDWIPAE